MAKQTIGEFLATLRKANGYTQQEVADRLGISNRTLSGWECDKVLPDILLLPALAELYGVTVDDIIAGERKQKDNVVLTSKAEIGLYKSKLTKFTTQSWVLLGIIILGLIFFCAGTFFASTVIGIIMLSLGIACLVVGIFVLLALWHGTDYDVDETSTLGRTYCILRRSKLSKSLCVISISFFIAWLFFAAWMFVDVEATTRYENSVPVELNVEFNWARIVVTLIAIAVPLLFFLVGKSINRKALLKWGDSNISNKLMYNRNYHFTVAFWGLIPFVVAVAIAVGYTLYKYFHYDYNPYGVLVGLFIVGIDIIVCIALCMKRQFGCEPKL